MISFPVPLRAQRVKGGERRLYSHGDNFTDGKDLTAGNFYTPQKFEGLNAGKCVTFVCHKCVICKQT